MRKAITVAFLLALAVTANAQQPATEQIEIDTGVPLHIRVTHTAKLRLGEHVVGVLAEPIYVYSRLAVPAGSIVHGTVTGYIPIPGVEHAQALLNGDVTPLHNPLVDFYSVHLAAANRDIALDTRAVIHDTQIVRFIAVKKKPSLVQQGKSMVAERIKETRKTFFGPNKKDRALRFLYGQLPYHPQRIWAGTQFVADLQAPVAVTLAHEPRPVLAKAPSLDGITIAARLANPIDSKFSHKGDIVSAIVTQPVWDTDHHLVLPEGIRIDGVVSQAKPARSFGRNGSLRFAIRGVDLPGQEVRPVYGTLTGAEGNAAQNVTVDDEGNVQANPDKNRFVAPLLLAVTAVSGHDDDRRGVNNVGGTTVASNGFGVVARVIGLTVSNQNVAVGFGMYALAKSIYFRFLTRGHEVSFPKDTQIEVQLSARSAGTAVAK
jgi:hypothetical protein